jgi:hypothetical protein
MTKYIIAVLSTPVKKSPSQDAGKNGDLKRGSVVDITDQQNGYGFQTLLRGWIKMGDVLLYEAQPTPTPVPTP